MRRSVTVVACVILLAPGVAWAAENAESLSVTGVIMAALAVVASAIVTLLGWSLKNNVQGLEKSATKADDKAEKAIDRADESLKSMMQMRVDMMQMRVEMAHALTRKDMDELRADIRQVSTQVGVLTSQVAVLNAHKEQSHAPGH